MQTSQISYTVSTQQITPATVNRERRSQAMCNRKLLVRGILAEKRSRVETRSSFGSYEGLEENARFLLMG